ncbi:hypothetical protein [Mucilaginibacter antarcticus]|uniref:Uncharacterized protein n=1 Tax=Mucilaginibacter antarcticus TaxID=1855725 RepID=A0ABW5XVC9_9SPHI
MKKNIILNHIKNEDDKSEYYEKLFEISQLLIDTEWTLYHKISELIRHYDVEENQIRYESHKNFVRKYFRENKSPHNCFLIELLNSIRTGIVETYNPSINHYLKTNKKGLFYDKKLNRKIK